MQQMPQTQTFQIPSQGGQMQQVLSLFSYCCLWKWHLLYYTLICNNTNGQSNKAASPPQMDGKIVFVSWRQCPSHEGMLAPPGKYDSTYASFRPTRVTNPSGKPIGSGFLHSCRRTHRACPCMSFRLIMGDLGHI